MIRYIYIFLITIIISTSDSLSDFRSKEKIAPGVIYYHEYLLSGPWHLHVLEIDLKNPVIRIESAKAGNSLFWREKTSVISRGKNGDHHYIIGAINADFFEYGNC